VSVGLDSPFDYICELSITNGGYFGDFETDAYGQPIFVTDTANSDAATQQRVNRLLRMMTGSDMFHPNSGSDLPGHVGDNWTFALEQEVTAKITNGLKTFSTISQDIPPNIVYQQYGTSVYATITYTRITGAKVTLPPLPINTSGG
jgi:hypothetical protein